MSILDSPMWIAIGIVGAFVLALITIVAAVLIALKLLGAADRHLTRFLNIYEEEVRSRIRFRASIVGLIEALTLPIRLLFLPVMVILKMLKV